MKRTNIKKKKDASILFKKSGQKANKRMKNLRHSLYSRSSLCVFSLRSIHQPCVNPVSPPHSHVFSALDIITAAALAVTSMAKLHLQNPRRGSGGGGEVIGVPCSSHHGLLGFSLPLDILRQIRSVETAWPVKAIAGCSAKE